MQGSELEIIEVWDDVIVVEVSDVVIEVAVAEDVIEVVVGEGALTTAWGSITGTLGNQRDLQEALDEKADADDLGALALKDAADWDDDIANKPSSFPPAAHDHDDRYYTEAETDSLLSGKSDVGHTHDDRYYTEAETDTLLSGKSDTDHTHDDRYYTEGETDSLLAGKSDTGHTHDDRYYTEAEVDTALAGKQDVLTFDNVPAAGSTNPVTSDGIKLALDDKAAVIVCGVSGAPAAFSDGAPAPVVDLTVEIEPVQSGTGDPSPTNIRPITGWTGCNVVKSRVFTPNQFVKNGNFESTNNWTRLRTTVSVENNVIKMQGNGTNAVNGIYQNLSTIDAFNHIFFATGDVKGDTAVAFHITINYGIANATNIITSGTTSTSWETFNGIMRFGQQSSYGFGYRFVTQTSQERIPDDSYVYLKNAMIIDLTELFGEQVAEQILAMEQAEYGAGISVIKGFFPEEYYPTNNDTSPENDGQGSLYPISWQSEAGTVYGGSLDVTTGILSVDRETVTVTNCESIGSANLAKILAAGITPKPLDNDTVTGTITSYLKSYSRNEMVTDTSIVGILCTSSGTLYIRIANFTTKEEYDAYLTMNPLQVVYELVTPVTYQLDPTELSTLLGQNTISADTGPVTLRYRADTKLYIDGKFAELQALILEN